MNRRCKYCDTEFPEMEGRVFSNHVRWCVKNPQRNNSKCCGINKKLLEYQTAKYGAVELHIKTCKKCGDSYQVNTRKVHLDNPKKTKQYCSRACANSRTHSNKTKRKIQTALTLIAYPTDKECIRCKSKFTVDNAREYRRQYCSNACRKNKRRESMDKVNIYRRDCQFKFALNSYPDEFNFDLIKLHGWYSAKNRGDNLGGVSRDHMVPIMYGFNNNIPTEIISHPANCEIMIHNDNVSKGAIPSITLESLIYKIEKWELKYGKY